MGLLGLLTADSTESRVVTGLIAIIGIAMAIGLRNRKTNGR